MNELEWFAAHTLIAHQRKDGVGAISVCENIHLVSAENSEAAWEKAKQLSDLESQDDDGTEIDGFHAKCVFGGVRKIVTICNQTPPQSQARPNDGSEISYFQYEVGSLEELEKIAAGNSGVVNFVD